MGVEIVNLEKKIQQQIDFALHIFGEFLEIEPETVSLIFADNSEDLVDKIPVREELIGEICDDPDLNPTYIYYSPTKTIYCNLETVDSAEKKYGTTFVQIMDIALSHLVNQENLFFYDHLEFPENHIMDEMFFGGLKYLFTSQLLYMLVDEETREKLGITTMISPKSLDHFQRAYEVRALPENFSNLMFDHKLDAIGLGLGNVQTTDLMHNTLEYFKWISALTDIFNEYYNDGLAVDIMSFNFKNVVNINEGFSEVIEGSLDYMMQVDTLKLIGATFWYVNLSKNHGFKEIIKWQPRDVKTMYAAIENIQNQRATDTGNQRYLRRNNMPYIRIVDKS